MVNRQNIQVLLDEIVMENMKTYMSDSGWGLSEPEDQDVCIFTRQHEEGEQRLWLWKSTSHPKFRSRVQNIIFSLAVQSNREPIEIANEIYDSVAPESNPDSSEEKVAADFQIDLVNSLEKDICVFNPGNWSSEFKLEPGQGICLKIDKPNCPPTIEYGNAFIKITSSESSSFRTFSRRTDGNPPMELIDAPDWNEFLTNPKSGQSVENCEASWDRASFDFSGLQPSPGYEKGVLKTVAVLLVAVAQEDTSEENEDTPEENEFATKLWRLCEQVLCQFGLQIEVFPDCEKELAQTARFDRPASPSNSLDWLGLHTILGS